jgi:SNF2 family DNA or RNA helicase
MGFPTAVEPSWQNLIPTPKAIVVSKIPSRLKYRYKTEPFSHQKRALKKLVMLNGKAGLLMEMGTGKTKVAIDFAGIGFYNFEVRRVLVVAPLSVLGVWPRQIRQHSGAPSRIFRLTGPTTDRVRLLKRISQSSKSDILTYVVINYEGIWRESDEGSIRDLLVQWKADLVIWDECHRLKSPTSKQSRAAYVISQSARFRLGLTGTHITKSPLDVFGQFRAIDDKVFGSNWYSFRFTYGVWGGFGKFQLRGYRHLRTLITKVRENSFRVKKEDCLDLPPKLFQTVPVTLSEKAEILYRKMAKEMIIEIEDTHATAAIVLVKLLRLSQITSGFVKDVDGNIKVFDDNKLNTCMDLVDDLLEEDHKVVIFVRFRNDIERIKEKLVARKVQHAILSGSVPVAQRDSLVARFQRDPDLKVFIAQVQAGSLGIELYAADTAIFYSLDYNAANYWQAQDRIHRHGQTKKVTYYHLVVPRSIDQIVLQTLKEKGDLAQTIIHTPRRLLEL